MKREYEPPRIDVIEFELLDLLTVSDPSVEVYEDEEHPIWEAQ